MAATDRDEGSASAGHGDAPGNGDAPRDGDAGALTYGRTRNAVLDALRDLGISTQELHAASERGRIDDALFDSLAVPERAERTVPSADIEAAGGLTTAETGELMSAFGLPAPDPGKATFTPFEASALIDLGRMRSIWPPAAQLQVARIYGDALARIARVEAHLFRYYVERPARESSGDPISSLVAVRHALEQLRPLTQSLLNGVHERWLEHELAQAAVGEAEVLTSNDVPGATEVSLLFCDLSDFTAFADAQGDAAAVEAIDHFGEIGHAAVGDRGRVVKELGDGLMIAFAEPELAVEAAIDILEEVAGIEALGAHAAVHHGVAVYRQGDYFGRSVNLAARLADIAQRGELLATEPVVRATEATHNWADRGARRLRGVSDPVHVYVLADVV